MSATEIPPGLGYTSEHEWVSFDEDIATVGVTAYAADQLGDVVYVALPAVGTAVESGRVAGEIESTKSVAELYSPVDGAVIEVNAEINDDPEAINRDPYAAWLFKVRVTGRPELLDSVGYAALIGS